MASAHPGHEKHRNDGQAPPHEKSSTKEIALRVLTTLQRGSAPFISLFVGIHLAAPISACFGGSSAATNTMLLGREYYQRPLTEPLLLFVPLGIHIGSGVLRRLILKPPKRPTLVTTTAYLALFSASAHIVLHRLRPSLPDPPISSFSPSEMSYEYVKMGFATYPIATWIGYPFLVAVVLLHAADGASIVSRWFTGRGLSKQVRRGVALLTTAAVIAGLYRISSEPLMLRGAQLARIQAIYSGVPGYALLDRLPW